MGVIVSGLAPSAVRDCLISQGWKVIDETATIWLMDDPSNPKSEPIAIPKHGDSIDPAVMDSIFHVAPHPIMRALRKQIADTLP